MTAFERQQARKRAEIHFGPWALRLEWISKSRLIEERRLANLYCGCGRHTLDEPPFDGLCDNAE
jgi:hypothetical protein